MKMKPIMNKNTYKIPLKVMHQKNILSNQITRNKSSAFHEYIDTE